MPTVALLSLLAPVSVFVLAVANTPAPAPDLTGLAAVITAAIGVFGFLATLWRGKKNNARVSEIEDAASYVKGFDSLTKRLREEIEEIHDEQKEERAHWINERAQLEEKMSQLRIELNEQTSNNYRIRGELAELRGQIRGYLSAKQYAEFQKHIR